MNDVEILTEKIKLLKAAEEDLTKIVYSTAPSDFIKGAINLIESHISYMSVSQKKDVCECQPSAQVPDGLGSCTNCDKPLFNI